MSVLGHYCHELKELDVSFCSYVTDSGIYSLLISFDRDNTRRPDLVKLSIIDTMVTGKGVQVRIVAL